jgi:phospholipase/carboxylesterase
MNHAFTDSVESSFTHRFVPATGSKAPSLLLLHGTGGDENDLLPLGQAIAPGAALISPRGKVLEGTMPRFFRRLAMGVFDQEDLAFRTQELAEFIQWASKRYSLERERMIAVGLSNGANIAASLLFRRPEMIGGAVLLRAMLPFEPETLPDLSGKPILLLGGTRDPIVPRDQVEELASLYRAAGADLSLNWVNAGHELTHAEVATAKEWLGRKYLLDQPAGRV